MRALLENRTSMVAAWWPAAIVMVALFATGCASNRTWVPTPSMRDAADLRPMADPDLDRLAAWLTGSFSSRAQAAVDSAYHDVRLHMVPIWTGRRDGHWLYIEQSLAAREDQPYRQRIYHLTRDLDGLLRSAVFELDDPLRFAGAWRDRAPLGRLSPDSLTWREGCYIVVVADGDSFVGSTRGSACMSSLRGASYATSEVRITAGGVTSWDRGFDAEGRQVWGAEKGPYVFVREDAP